MNGNNSTLEIDDYKAWITEQVSIGSKHQTLDTYDPDAPLSPQEALWNLIFGFAYETITGEKRPAWKKATEYARRKKTRREGMERKKRYLKRVKFLKIDESKLNRKQKGALEGYFREAKNYANDAIGSESVFSYVVTDKFWVKMPDGSFEHRDREFIAKDCASKVIEQLRSDVGALSAAKQNGSDVGTLKLKKQITMIPLIGLGRRRPFDIISNNKVRLAKVGKIWAQGLDQLKNAEELGNPQLLKKADGYYISVLAYEMPENNKTYQRNNDAGRKKTQRSEGVGVDLGMKQQAISSDPLISTNFRVTEQLDRLAGLQRKLARQVPGSNGYVETREKIRRVYLKLSRLKEYAARMFVRELLDAHEVIYFQDEQIAGWAKSRVINNKIIRQGKAIAHGILGRIKELLLALVPTGRAVMLDKMKPTTALCICGVKTKHQPDKRRFECSSCGYSDDRDVHAAKNMIRIGHFGHKEGSRFNDYRLLPILWGTGEPPYAMGNSIPLGSNQPVAASSTPQSV